MTRSMQKMRSVVRLVINWVFPGAGTSSGACSPAASAAMATPETTGHSKDIANTAAGTHLRVLIVAP
jgi:hypothetical protein